MSPKALPDIKETAEIPARVLLTTSDAYTRAVIESIYEGLPEFPFTVLEMFCEYGKEKEGWFKTLVSSEVDEIVRKHGRCLIVDLLVHVSEWDVLLEVHGKGELQLPHLLVEDIGRGGLTVNCSDIGRSSRVDLTFLADERVHVCRMGVHTRILHQLVEKKRESLVLALRRYITTHFLSLPTS